MGDKHKAKAGRIIRQEQEKRIKQLEDKLAWENTNRKGDRNVIVKKDLDLPMKSRVYSATTFWIVCRRLGINSLWCYIQEFAPECGGIVEWMFDSKNINHEIERHWSDRKK